MKLLICSDIHGDAEAVKNLLDAFKKERADKILILGDLLYHGPRNDLPKTYAPKEAIELLNANKNVILSVRGNCDTEVDQMVLEFPILAGYAYFELYGLVIFATHGHHHNTATPPPLREGEILLHGHTHVLKCEPFGNGNYYLNPGSASLPKENNPKTYMIYENRTFTVKDFLGNKVLEKSFN
jgi:putative phosphoesterase